MPTDMTPLPRPTLVKNMGLRVTPDDYAQLSRYAQLWGCSAAEAVRRLLHHVWQETPLSVPEARQALAAEVARMVD